MSEIELVFFARLPHRTRDKTTGTGTIMPSVFERRLNESVRHRRPFLLGGHLVRFGGASTDIGTTKSTCTARRVIRRYRGFCVGWTRQSNREGRYTFLGAGVKLVTSKSYGFCTGNAYETARYHNLGARPRTNPLPRIHPKMQFHTVQ